MSVWTSGELDEWYGNDHEDRAEAMVFEREAADEEPDREPSAETERGWDAREEWMNGA